jgi:hypothetical protein
MEDLKYKVEDGARYARCQCCKEWLLYNTAFFYAKKGKLNISNCKPCHKKKTKAYAQKHPENYARYKRNYRRKLKEKNSKSNL